MCAKAGGSPWVCQTVPYTDAPTMVVGIDVFQKVGKFSCFALAASMDNKFSNFVNYERQLAAGAEISERML